MRLWGTRFKKKPKMEFIEYISGENVKVDERLIPYDVLGSLAHLYMLYERKIINKEEFAKISKGLIEIKEEWKKGEFLLNKEMEDVHTNIEAALYKKIGESAGKLHTARSRNDQINLDVRLYLRDEINNIIWELINLQEIFISKAEKNIETIMPGYTHLQPAQPITFAFWCCAYADAFCRCIQRLEDAYKRLNINPLGAGALAGTSLNIDRKLTATLLLFEGVQENPLDVVSSRGEFEAEVVCALSLTMLYLSKIAEELIIYSTREFGFVELSDEYTSGSSLLPQKKNPDALELIRGRTSRVYGHLFHILSLLKSLPSGHYADTQETKFALFDSFDTTKNSIRILSSILRSLMVNKKRMKEAAENGYLTAVDLVDELVKKGIPFRKAHGIVGKAVLSCIEKGVPLSKIKIGKEEVRGVDILSSIKARPTSPKNVKKFISSIKKFLLLKKNAVRKRRNEIQKAERKLFELCGSL